MTDDPHLIVDWHQAACLCDAGQPDYLGAVVVDAAGAQHLALVETEAIGDESVGLDARCRGVAHEQLGPLPLEYTRRLAVACRRITGQRVGQLPGVRCGRTTHAGTPCKLRVREPGAACVFHSDRMTNHEPTIESTGG